MSVEVIKKIDYSCDKSLGNTSSVDLFMHDSHSHSIWGETVSVPSNSDFQTLFNSIKSLENRLGNIEKSLREWPSKIQAQDRIIAGISEKEKKFFDDICNKLKDSLAEGSPFFIQISSKIQNHIQTIQQSEKAIRESATSVENNKKTVENTANSSLQIIKKEMLGLQELCERLKKNSLDFFSQSHSKLENTANDSLQKIKKEMLELQESCERLQKDSLDFFSQCHSKLENVASNSQAKINTMQDKTRELEAWYEKIEEASKPFYQDISFVKRLKWLFTGRI